MQTEIKYGFIAGALMIGGLFAEYYAGIGGSSLAGGTPALTSIMFLAVVIVLGIRERKRDEKNGLSYSQAFLSGLIIAFIAGLILGCYSYAYVDIMDPNYVKQTLYLYEKSLHEHHIPDADIKLRVQSYASLLSPVSQFMSATGTTVLLGLLISGIAGIFFKRKESKA